ncbi:MAG TPA: hypothetical protein VGL78_17370, partial [Solirubrobacteraceae bacterium]
MAVDRVDPAQPRTEASSGESQQATPAYEALLERDGVKVSKSPWGPDDEIGRMNWITPDSRRAVLEHLDGSTL